MRKLISTSVFILIVSITVTFGQAPAFPFKNFTDFRKELNRITSLNQPEELKAEVVSLWDNLKNNNQIPCRVDDSVAFLYYGEAKSVSWAGDFNGWKPGQPDFTGARLGNSDVWIMCQKFPTDARLDYKIIVDDQWILDPANPYRQMSGMGPNSELHMPNWRFPDETELSPDVIRGNLSETMTIKSKKLGYSVNYKVYTPYNYFQVEGLPSIYVTDGQDYADDEKGAMLNVLDNLIYSGEIKPLIAIFIDPREPGNEANNRRMKEYNCSRDFADFMDLELIPAIDKSFKTHDCPDDRVILGTSVGGIAAAWLGAVKINRFHLLGINSPAFNKTVLDTFAAQDWFPFHVFMTTGTFYDTQKQALEMKAILEKNQVDFKYREVNQGHSWGAWKVLLADMLLYFFPM